MRVQSGLMPGLIEEECRCQPMGAETASEEAGAGGLRAFKQPANTGAEKRRGSIPEGPVGQPGGETSRRPQSGNDDRRAIVRWHQRRVVEGGARQGDEWRQRGIAAYRYPPHRAAAPSGFEFRPDAAKLWCLVLRLVRLVIGCPLRAGIGAVTRPGCGGASGRRKLGMLSGGMRCPERASDRGGERPRDRLLGDGLHLRFAAKAFETSSQIR